MKLAIISHTPHYMNGGKISGWGPTIREINHLTEVFESIYHIAPLHSGTAPPSSLHYEDNRIFFVPLKPYGGKSFVDKISIFTTAFHNLKVIKSVLKNVDWVQFRSPTAMGVYVLPYLSARKEPKRWVKYAGNWKLSGTPMSYRFQKWWLKKNFLNSFVTVNGDENDEKNNILNFRNPCLDNEELANANAIADKKDYSGKLTICFSGTLTNNKGVGIILDSVSRIKRRNEIERIIFAGDGPDRERYESEASGSDLDIVFKGFMNRNDLKDVYAQSHLILLPSESEGFPKVIAEAASYGCVPVVSDVSAISRYFNDSNGFLLKEISSDALAHRIDEALMDREMLKNKSKKCSAISKLFTFEDYIKNLREKILKEE